MRRQIFNPDTNRLVYGIREMVELSQRIAQLNPDFRFIGENIGDLLVSLFARGAGEIRVAVTGLRLSGERGQEVLFGPGPFQ